LADRKLVVAIIQARMGSTRLPGKALTMIKGKAMLDHVLRRVRNARSIDAIAVATTIARQDDAIVDFCRERNCVVFRGSETDVLDRYRMAAQEAHAGVIVRITSDCPLMDPAAIDATTSAYFAGATNLDYASNTLEPRTFPRGLDVEVMSRTALERAWTEDKDPASREHVTPYMYRHPEIFSLRRVENDRDLHRLRWTVDTPADLAFVEEVYKSFDSEDFGQSEVVALLERRPEIALINAGVQQKSLN
jgi:spore coat polysaccharide biosynthesis protein SpsF